MEALSEKALAQRMEFKVGSHLGFTLGAGVFGSVLFLILWKTGRMSWTYWPWVGVWLAGGLLLYLIISRIGKRKVPAEEF